MSTNDSVWADCPSCGRPNQFRTEAEDPEMSGVSWHVGRDLIPADLAFRLRGAREVCRCGKLITITCGTSVPMEIK